MTEDLTKKPSFWSTKEGTWGLAIGLGVIAALVFFKGAILASATVLATTLGTGFAYGIIGATALFFIHGFFIDGWMMLKYQVFCYGLRKAIIDENPITILKMWKTKAQERMKKIRESKDAVKKEETNTGQVHNSFKVDFTRFQSQANTLKGDASRVQMFRSACGNMAKAADAVKETYAQLLMIQGQYTRINEAYKDLEVMYADMEYEETVLVRKFQVSGALDQVWSRMRSIFKGESEWDRMRADAVDSINNKYAERMGRVESAIDDCQGKFDDMKLTKEMNENDGMAMFNQLSGTDINQLLAAPSAPLAISFQPTESISVGTRSYADLLKK